MFAIQTITTTQLYSPESDRRMTYCNTILQLNNNKNIKKEDNKKVQQSWQTSALAMHLMYL